MGRALIRRVRALAVAYLSQVLVVMCGWAFPLILNRFWKYEAVLYCSLFGLSLITFPVHRLTVSFRQTVLCGAITGYVASVISGNLTPLFEGKHLHDLLHSWRVMDMECFLMGPVVIFGWLIGICFGLGLLVQERGLAREVQAIWQRIWQRI